MSIFHLILLAVLVFAAPVYAEDQTAYYNNTGEEVTTGASSPAYEPSDSPAQAPVAQVQPQKNIYEMIEEAQQLAADKFGLSQPVKSIMKSIKKVESGGNPWALCVNLGDGKFYSIHPRNYYEAVYYLEHLKTDNIDIGPWQVNYISWGRRYGYKKTDLLNPYISAMLAAYILYSEIAQHGSTWDAIGNYHSHTLWRKVRYVKNVKAELRKEGYLVDSR